VHPSAKTISRLLGLLHEAVASPDCWPDLLNAVPRSTYKSSIVFNEFIRPQANGNWDWCCGGSARDPFAAPASRIRHTHTRLTQLRCQNAELCQSGRSHRFSSDQLWLQMDDCSRRAALREQSFDCRYGLQVDRGFLRASLPEEQAYLAIAGAVATGSGRVRAPLSWKRPHPRRQLGRLLNCRRWWE